MGGGGWVTEGELDCRYERSGKESPSRGSLKIVGSRYQSDRA